MTPITRLLDWLAASLAHAEHARRETYLAQAVDHCDLEYRLRELERAASRSQDW